MNCQVAVSLSFATEAASVPIDYRLYLPKAWAEDDARRAAVGVPEEVVFQRKQATALGCVGESSATTRSSSRNSGSTTTKGAVGAASIIMRALASPPTLTSVGKVKVEFTGSTGIVEVSEYTSEAIL